MENVSSLLNLNLSVFHEAKLSLLLFTACLLSSANFSVLKALGLLSTRRLAQRESKWNFT